MTRQEFLRTARPLVQLRSRQRYRPGKFLQQLVNAGGGILECAQVQHLTLAVTTPGRDRKPVLGHINSDVGRCMGLPHVFLYRKKDGTRRPAIRMQTDPSWPGR